MAQFKFEQDTFRLIRVGWFTALALTIHNIPEGMLTYVSALSSNPSVGLGIACAIGLHNIPEGFAVAFPIMIGIIFEINLEKIKYYLTPTLSEKTRETI